MESWLQNIAVFYTCLSCGRSTLRVSSSASTATLGRTRAVVTLATNITFSWTLRRTPTGASTTSRWTAVTRTTVSSMTVGDDDVDDLLLLLYYRSQLCMYITSAITCLWIRLISGKSAMANTSRCVSTVCPLLRKCMLSGG